MVHIGWHIWKPSTSVEGPQSGVFGHLLASQGSPDHQARLTTSPVTMTFAKFRRDVMPRALEIQVRVPARGQFCAFTAAVERGAPPILQWDSEEIRNPFAWYVYHNGSPASQWGLSAGRLARVICVSEMPPVWTDRTRWKDYGNSVLLVLEGARDSMNTSLALFPECLRGELHEVRRSIVRRTSWSRKTGAARGRPFVYSNASGGTRNSSRVLRPRFGAVRPSNVGDAARPGLWPRVRPKSKRATSPWLAGTTATAIASWPRADAGARAAPGARPCAWT